MFQGSVGIFEANPNLHRFGGSYKELYIFHVADRQVGTVDLNAKKIQLPNHSPSLKGFGILTRWIDVQME